MGTLKDRQLLNLISALQGNSNKLASIETLKNIKKVVEIIENMAKTCSVTTDVDNVILSIK